MTGKPTDPCAWCGKELGPVCMAYRKGEVTVWVHIECWGKIAERKSA